MDSLDIREKLRILSAAAKFDVSCSSSGGSRKNKPGGIGNSAPAGICHSFTSDGRCISLLKILLTNYCVYDCAYCVNRSTSDVERAAFTPEEIADLTINFYRRNYIEGLFLSSAVFRDPDHTMELMIRAAAILRNEYSFNGYIHLKAIPGADPLLIEKAGALSDRMSVNIELPSSRSLMLLAPQKSRDNVLKPMSQISAQISAAKLERKTVSNAPKFVPAGQSTQLIVGASPESDFRIISLSESLYEKYRLKRVYYSAYVPVSNSPLLPSIRFSPLLREHRLYQADWLLRFYGFKASEILSEGSPTLDLNHDPKTNWALNNIDFFPVEINKASYRELLRVPGIGMTSAKRIISARWVRSLDFSDLKVLGIVMKRAQYFITCGGRYFGDVPFSGPRIRGRLSPKQDLNLRELEKNSFEQLSFLDSSSRLLIGSAASTSMSGEF
ncbi:MAG: Elongator protein 3/MiaB/NifB [Firmicutes bacterium]|nr:Elongator protein 3/MiaB/NifB [Bacillota bacterium]